MKSFQVIGDPIAHSRSPQIHRAFAAQFGHEIDYQKARVSGAQLAEHLDAFRGRGGAGLNVTVPHKEAAFHYVDEADEHARVAKAVNTISFTASQALGSNTDGQGLVRDIEQRHGLLLKDRNVLILGAGGATRGVILPLLMSGVRVIFVANRTAARARSLVVDLTARLPEEFAGRLAVVEPPVATLPGGTHADIIINATSLSVASDHADAGDYGGLIVPQTLRGGFCYDMSYGAGALFTRYARDHGAGHGVDGLGMLVEQAALAYEIWHGVMPDTDPVYRDLRRSIDATTRA